MEQTVIGVSVDPGLGLSREQVAERTAAGRVNVVTRLAGRKSRSSGSISLPFSISYLLPWRRFW